MSDQKTETQNTTALAPAAPAATAIATGHAFSGLGAFEGAQRMAKALAESDLVPAQFKGKLANCLVALEVAQRCGSSPLMVMQNLNVIHGRPSWSSTYIIAAINSCGRFSPLRFEMTGEVGKDTRTCVAWAKDLASGDRLEAAPVSISMAKAEGWWGKSGSKWPTMSEQMLRYRAASFFGRLYAAEILMGMRSQDEEEDVIDISPGAAPVADQVAAKTGVNAINDKVRAGAKKAPPAAKNEPEVMDVEAKPATAPTAPANATEVHL